MAKRHQKGGSDGSRSSFNTNLYEKTRGPEQKKAGTMDRMAYCFYCICAIIFAVIMMISFSQNDSVKGSVYLVLLCAALYLIRVFRKKTGGK